MTPVESGAASAPPPGGDSSPRGPVGRPDELTLSVVVPVYNSQDSLHELANRLEAVLPSVASRFELILVNDGSRDASWKVVQELASRHEWVRGIDMLRNYGQHNAVLCGIRAARYDVVVTMDDDLQHPPEELPRLLGELSEGYDVVYGTAVELPHELWRNLTSRITKLALRAAMGAETAGKVSAFRAFRTGVRDAFADYRSPFLSVDVLLTWGTTRFGSVRLKHAPRKFGTSNYTFRKLVTHALNMMTGFSVLPLQLASLTGFGFTGFGFGVLVWVVGRYLLVGSPVQGFPFLASIISIFGGVQLFALGIIGEYLARMHFRMMEKPTYAVRARTRE